jgi:hypothetical protein
MRFVLLHSPLIGPLAWSAVAGELAKRGIGVILPVIPPLGELTASLYAGVSHAVASQILGQDGPFVLAVHSGAGGLAPAIVAAAGRQVEAVLYVDAILPHPGRSWFETASDALGEYLKAKVVDGMVPAWDQWLPPQALAKLLPDYVMREAFVAELKPTPLAWFEERAPEIDLPPDVGSGFLRLSESYDSEAEEAQRLGWPALRRNLHHLAMATHPEDVTTNMLALARALKAA